MRLRALLLGCIHLGAWEQLLLSVFPERLLIINQVAQLFLCIILELILRKFALAPFKGLDLARIALEIAARVILLIATVFFLAQNLLFQILVFDCLVSSHHASLWPSWEGRLMLFFNSLRLMQLQVHRVKGLVHLLARALRLPLLAAVIGIVNFRGPIALRQGIVQIHLPLRVFLGVVIERLVVGDLAVADSGRLAVRTLIFGGNGLQVYRR